MRAVTKQTITWLVKSSSFTENFREQRKFEFYAQVYTFLIFSTDIDFRTHAHKFIVKMKNDHSSHENYYDSKFKKKRQYKNSETITNFRQDNEF